MEKGSVCARARARVYIYMYIYKSLIVIHLYFINLKLTASLNKKEKRKAIPVTDRGTLYSYEISRIPHCLENRLTDGGEVVIFTLQRRFTLP
jgi:hypothetical protein